MNARLLSSSAHRFVLATCALGPVFALVTVCSSSAAHAAKCCETRKCDPIRFYEVNACATPPENEEQCMQPDDLSSECRCEATQLCISRNFPAITVADFEHCGTSLVYEDPNCKCVEWTKCRDDDECEQKAGGNSVNVVNGVVTDTPRRPDATVNTANGPLTLRRNYSSRVAVDAQAQELAVPTAMTPQTWGGGWHHDFSHQLWADVGDSAILSPAGGTDSSDEEQTKWTIRFVHESDAIAYQAPDGSRERFTHAAGIFAGRRSVRDQRLLFGGTPSAPVVRFNDGTRILFEPVDEYRQGVGLRAARPLEITEAGGRTLYLRYYATTESAPCWADDSDEHKLRRLCMVRTDDDATLFFRDYASSTGSLTTVDYGRGDNVEEFSMRTSYEYANYPDAEPRLAWNEYEDPAPPGAPIDAVALGYENSCLLLENAQVRCWGDLNSGCKDAPKLSRPTCSVEWWNGEESAWNLLFAQSLSSDGNSAPMCAVRLDGAVMCWGENERGQLARSDVNLISNSPLLAVAAYESMVGVAAGTWGTVCAWGGVDGSAKCWGYNGYGGVGNGDAGANVYEPTSVMIAEDTRLTGVTSMGVGGQHTCAVVAGKAMCWGANHDGQLGLGKEDATSLLPQQVVDAFGNDLGASVVVASGYTSCALNEADGSVWCWGSGASGQLGNGAIGSRVALPVGTENSEFRNRHFRDIALGYSHACAVAEHEGEDEVWCWGSNGMREIRDDATKNFWTPVRALLRREPVRSIAAVSGSTCVVYERGDIACWGGRTYNNTPFNVAVSPAAMLKKVVHERRNGSGGYDVVDSETYDYTSRSYFRPDMPPGMERGENAPLTMEIHYTGLGGTDGVFGTQTAHVEVFLLNTVRGHSLEPDGPGPFVSSHEYDSARRGVVDVTAGEFLRLAYADVTSTVTVVDGNRVSEYEVYDGGIVTVHNDSNDGTTQYDISSTGRIRSIAGDCGCASGGATIEYYTDGPHKGRVKARRKADPDVSDGALGTRTMYAYDTAGRVTLTLENWEDHSLPDGLVFDPLQGPTRVRAYRYAPYATPEPLETSRVFSAMCPRAEHQFGLACPEDWADEEPRTIREYADLQLTRRVEVGLTLVNAYEAEIRRVHQTTDYHYEDDGVRLKRVVPPGPLGATEYFYYGPDESDNRLDDGQLKEIVSSGVTTQTFSEYGELGKPGRSVDENGVSTETSYDAFGNVACRELSYQGVTRATCYDYNTDGTVARVEVTGGSGTPVVYTDYDYSLPAELQDPTDAAFCDTQDLLDASAIHDAHEDCLDALGHLRQPAAMERGVEEGGLLYPHAADRYEYDRAGNRTDVATENAMGDVSRKTSYGHDREGRETRRFKYTDDLQNPAFLAESYHDGAGNLIAASDERFADVAATRLHNRVMANRVSEYDALGRLTAVAEYTDNSPDGAAVTLYGYDVHDNLVKVTDPDGRVTRYLYDDFGQLVVVRSPDSGETRYAYDAAGNLVQVVRADGSLQVNTYDARGRLTKEEFNAHLETSPLNRYYFYDEVPGETPPTACGEEFAPGFLRGRLAMVQHGAGTTYYSYGPFGDVVAVFEETNAGVDSCRLRVTRYDYDGLGRLTGVTYPSGLLVHYEYAVGAMYPTGVHLVTDSGSTPVVTGIQHDVGGHVRHFDAGAVAMTTVRDYAGQTASVAYDVDEAAAFHWNVRDRDGAGNIRNIREDATGKELVVDYDDLGRVTLANGSLMRGYQDCMYDYDLAGNRTGEQCYAGSANPLNYEYSVDVDEASNRLEAISWMADEFGYDNGERVCSQDEVDVVRSFNVDDMGRATSGYTRKFPVPADAYSISYGADGRIASVSMDGTGESWDYLYNHQGLRLSKVSSSQTVTAYGYDTGGRLLTDDSGDIIREYVWLGGNPVAMVGTDAAGSTVYVVGTDHLGTPMRLWEPGSGAVAWAADYEVFGRAREYLPAQIGSPEVSISLRFPGQIHDKETGLHYNWWRFYDPDTGRYVTPDPLISHQLGRVPDIGNSCQAGGRIHDIELRWLATQIYAYAASNPLRFVDPLGLKEDEAECVLRCRTEYRLCLSRCGLNTRCILNCKASQEECLAHCPTICEW